MSVCVCVCVFGLLFIYLYSPGLGFGLGRFAWVVASYVLTYIHTDLGLELGVSGLRVE